MEKFKTYISDFVNAGLVSWEELTRSYRQACREAHPDLGGNHEAFLQVQREYRQALQIIEYQQKQKNLSQDEGFNLEKLFQEASYPPTLDLRSRFYFVFDLYYRFSLYDLSVSSATPLDSRNGRLLKTLLSLGTEYDPEFGTRFVDFHENRLLNFSSTPQARTWSGCKLDFWTGWQYFFRYQAAGREASKKVARSYWEGLLFRLQRAKINNTPLDSFTVWFLLEIEKSPVNFEI